MIWWRGLELAAMALGVCLVASGCGVPDVTFVATDAMAGDASVGSDAPSSADTSLDAPRDTQAADDGSVSEGGTCPGSIPAGFVLCCNDIACGGMCKAADCSKCAVCAASQVCCIHGNGATCNASGPCP
jgi:hypothetical protein